MRHKRVEVDQPGDVQAAARPTSRRERSGEARRQRILDAALEIFSRNGLHGSRLDQVADRADISKTNLLYYYPTKEALYLAVLHRVLERWVDPLEAFTAKSDPEEVLRTYITRKLAMSRDEPAASRLFCMEILHGAPMIGDILRGSLKNLVDRKTVVIRRWIRDGRLADIDPRHLLFTIWSVTQHYADFEVQVAALTGHSLRDPAFEARAVENVLAIVLYGALPRTP